jgi:hypothetical protein
VRTRPGRDAVTAPGGPASLRPLRPTLLPCLAALALGAPAEALAGGIALALVDSPAVAGEPVEATIEVDDPLGLVAAVEVDLARPGGPWMTQRAIALPGPRSPRRFRARFHDPALLAPAPPALRLRARALGDRGGVLAELGEAEPLTLELLDRPAAAARAGAEARHAAEVASAREPPGSALHGHLGLEGRAGSGARARLLVGAGGALSARTELVLLVALGPAFAEPAVLAGGGPLTLGVEAAVRAYARAPAGARWAAFAHASVLADLRLPGADAGGALGAGALLRLGPEVGLEASLFGGMLARDLAAGATPAAVGGLRVALRLAREGEEGQR